MPDPASPSPDNIAAAYIIKDLQKLLYDVISGSSSQEVIHSLALITLYFIVLSAVLLIAGSRGLKVPVSFSRLLLLALAASSLFLTWSSYFSWISTYPSDDIINWAI
jgi:hypothetical protein